MAIDINIFLIASVCPLIIGLIGLIDKSKLFAIFPFMGAILGYIVFNYVSADGQIAVGSTNYNDYPLILIPLFFAFGCLCLCAFKAAPSSKILETLFLGVGLAGIDAYFVPNVISGLATSNPVNLPPAMLGFVQSYGEVSVVAISVILMVYTLWSLFLK